MASCAVINSFSCNISKCRLFVSCAVWLAIEVRSFGSDSLGHSQFAGYLYVVSSTGQARQLLSRFAVLRRTGRQVHIIIAPFWDIRTIVSSAFGALESRATICRFNFHNYDSLIYHAKQAGSTSVPTWKVKVMMW